MVTDPVADFLNRLVTAGQVEKETVTLSHSNFLESIARVLEREGYVESIAIEPDGAKKEMTVTLAYEGEGRNARPRLHRASRVSKPSRRVYSPYQNVMPYKSGRGLALISTPEGIMTDKEAREKKVGGEVLCTLW